MAEVPGSILSGETFCCWNFLLSHSKASDANIAIIKQFCVFVKKLDFGRTIKVGAMFI